MCYDHEQQDVQHLIDKMIEKNEKFKGIITSIFVDPTTKPITFKDLQTVREAYLNKSSYTNWDR